MNLDALLLYRLDSTVCDPCVRSPSSLLSSPGLLRKAVSFIELMADHSVK